MSENCPAGLETSRNCPAGLETSRNCPAGLGRQVRRTCGRLRVRFAFIIIEPEKKIWQKKKIEKFFKSKKKKFCTKKKFFFFAPNHLNIEKNRFEGVHQNRGGGEGGPVWRYRSSDPKFDPTKYFLNTSICISETIRARKLKFEKHVNLTDEIMLANFILNNFYFSYFSQKRK